MATFPLNAPPLVPQTERLLLSHNAGVMRSPFAGNQTTIENFSEWVLELGFGIQSVASAKPFMAWRDSLRGTVGTFYYQPFGSGKPVTGKTLSATAYAYSDTISVDGWSASQSTNLVAGDFLSIGNKLFRIGNVPTNADANGRCIIEVAPRVRSDFAAGTSVEFQNPRGLFRQVDEPDKGSGYSRDPDSYRVDSLSAREVL